MELQYTNPPGRARQNLIVQDLAHFGILTTHQILYLNFVESTMSQGLVQGAKSGQKTLKKLKDKGEVKSISISGARGFEGSRQYAYHLPWKRNIPYTELGHRIMVVQTSVMMELLNRAANVPYEVVYYTPEFETVPNTKPPKSVNETSYSRSTVIPDVVTVINANGTGVLLYVECDTGSERIDIDTRARTRSRSSLVQKVENYLDLIEEEAYLQHEPDGIQISAVHILFIFLTQQRLERVRQKLLEYYEPIRSLWLTTFDNVVPESFWTKPCWISLVENPEPFPIIHDQGMTYYELGS